MKNNIPEQIVWVLVGALAISTFVLISSYHKMGGLSQNTANVIGIGRSCEEIMVPYDKFCASYTSGHENYCCHLVGQVIYASCIGADTDWWVEELKINGCPV